MIFLLKHFLCSPPFPYHFWCLCEWKDPKGENKKLWMRSIGSCMCMLAGGKWIFILVQRRLSLHKRNQEKEKFNITSYLFLSYLFDDVSFMSCFCIFFNIPFFFCNSVCLCLNEWNDLYNRKRNEKRWRIFLFFLSLWNFQW